MKLDGTLHIKYFILIYYTGHGDISGGTQRVFLHDGSKYPLETKIRNFKNDNSENCVVFGVFDACRDVSDVPNDGNELMRQINQSH